MQLRSFVGTKTIHTAPEGLSEGFIASMHSGSASAREGVQILFLGSCSGGRRIGKSGKLPDEMSTPLHGGNSSPSRVSRVTISGVWAFTNTSWKAHGPMAVSVHVRARRSP